MRMLRIEQQAIGANGAIHPHLYNWLALAGHRVVPSKGIITASLSAAEVTAYFDSTGQGKQGGEYDGWAICNGNNGTPNLAGRFIRVLNTGGGSTGGSDSSAHTHAVDPASATSGAPSATVVVAAGVGTTVATDTHTHATDVASTTSGAASSSDNRPAYYDLVSLMRTGGA